MEFFINDPDPSVLFEKKIDDLIMIESGVVVYNFSGRQEGILSHDDVHIPENLRY